MHRHRSRPAHVLALAAAALLSVSLSARRAEAQSVQVFINAAYVVNTSSGTGCGSTGTPPRFICPITNQPQSGNISNDPQIQFALNGQGRCNISPLSAAVNTLGVPLPDGTLGFNYCNSTVFLCTQVGVQNNASGSVAVDQLSFEVFRYVDGANPLDPASTPPLRTFFIDAPGTCPATSQCTLPTAGTAYCVLWDASQPIQGSFGKINGEYGFRVKVETNQQGDSGNIVISQTRVYPSGGTKDADNFSVSQKPIKIDVTDVHVVRSTPTVIGQITGVSAQPYNFTYRLSKDATMYVTLNGSNPPFDSVRTIVPGLPRTGEGALGNANAQPILNGDSWDGRDDQGNVLPPGSYLAVFQAKTVDQYTLSVSSGDLSEPTTTQISIDPLQITDIRVQSLQGGATSLAVLSYMLTEAATVYVDIFPPGTQFCAGLNSVNDLALDGPTPAKDFGASLGGCSGSTPSVPVNPLRTISQQQVQRQSVIAFWDGRDSSGNLMGDGDYVFVIYAALPSQAGVAYNGVANDKRIWTSQAKLGFISVLRGLVGITQVTPTSTIIGSSPAIAGLNPFSFRYQLSRDAVVSLRIYDATGSRLVKTLVNQETRPGNFNNLEFWPDGTDDAGQTVSSGTYLVELTARDPAFPAKVSTTTAQFPVDLFRITDVTVTPLLSGASDQVTISYQLSQPMFVAWNIYPPGSVVVNSSATWPPCSTQSPPNACTSSTVLSPGGSPAAPMLTFHGMRPGRLRITEYWDGRDSNGLIVPDGNYVFTLVAQSSTTPRTFATDRVYGTMAVARGAIVFLNFSVVPDVPSLTNSSNTITLNPYTINFTLSRQSSVTLQILNTAVPSQVMRTLLSGAVRQPNILQSEVWDGRDDRGNFLPFTPGGTPYVVRAIARDITAALASGTTAQDTVTYDPLRIYDLAITPRRSDTGNAIFGYQVSEPMKVSIKIYKPGTNFDSAGNPSPPDSVSLVRRIVNFHPARTPVQDSWDGRDFRLALVPDGTYKFKIVGSTDPTAIDSVTGDVLNPLALADDRLIDEVPVGMNGSADPLSDFEGNTFVYPNPVTGPTGTFSIHTPFRGKVQLKLYTVSGQLVLSRDFGERAASYQNGPVTYTWNKTNQSGRAIARGLYYALVRIEETEGGANVLQTVKKVYVP